MLRSVKENKKYILGMISIGLFGIGGLLLAPAAMYIIKVSDHHPKVFRGGGNRYRFCRCRNIWISV